MPFPQKSPWISLKIRAQGLMGRPQGSLGKVDLRLGEIEVFYPRAYVREPELTFPTRYAVTYQIIKQTPSGFRIEVSNLSRGLDSPPNALEWRTRGEVSM